MNVMKNDLEALFLLGKSREGQWIFVRDGLRTLAVLLLLGIAVFLYRALQPSPVNNWSVNVYGNQENYLFVVLIVLAAGLLLYPVLHYVYLIRDRKEINRLLACIESGAQAHTIKEYKKYKLSIPVGKKTVNGIVVHYLCIIMNNDNRPFHLPVDSTHIAEIKEKIARLSHSSKR